MNGITNVKAYNAVVKARTALLIDQPFFGCLAMHMELVEVNDPAEVDTMAVDGVCMYYHPPFVLSLTDEELEGVIAHEVHHVAYKHMVRRGHRDPQFWNYAGDFVINADLKKVIPPFKLPVPHLHDPQYDGMSTEEVYERLMQNAIKIPKLMIQLIGGKMKGKGAGSGKGGKDGQGNKDQGLGIDPTGCGGVIDAGKGPRKKDANGEPINPDKVATDWDANVRMAIGVAKNANAGTVPGYLQRLVQQLAKPKVNWKDYLRMFIDSTMSSEYSWARPNRRSASLGVLLPGRVPDALHHLVMKVDVSGSISHELARCMVSEGAGALEDGVCDKLTIAYFDTEIRHVDEYMRGDLVQCKVVAGGGTDYRQPLEWLKGIPDASAVVMLTDMMPSTWELEDPQIPYFWGAFAPESYLNQVRNQVPFGEIVHVDSSW